MHPDRAEQDQVERFATASHEVEVGQAVVEPFDAGRRMQRHRGLPHRLRWLDGNDVMAIAGEPRRIAPGSGANIQNAAWRGRYQMQHRPVRIQAGEALIAPEKLLRLLGVSLRAAYLR